MKKKIFIAGGTGLVGLNLFNELKKKNYAINSNYYSKKIIKKNFKFYNFENFNDCLKATKKVNVLYILAVKGAGIINLKKNFFNQTRANFLIRYNLLEASRINKVDKIIWVSSSTVYQPKRSKVKEKELNLNSEPYEIYRGTGWLYRYLEKLFIYYRDEFKMNINIIRTSSIYGPYDNFDFEKSHVTPALIKKAVDKKKLIVLGDKKVVRDFVFVKDLVKAILLISSSRKIKKIINFSSGHPTTIYTLANKIAKHTKISKIIFKNNKLKSSAPYRVLDNKEFNKLFPKFKRTKLDDGLIDTIKWYNRNKKN